MVVAIEQATDTSEQGDAEDFGILDQGVWSAVAHQGLPAIEGDIEGAYCSSTWHTGTDEEGSATLEIFLLLKGYCQRLYREAETVQMFTVEEEETRVYMYDEEQGTGYDSMQPFGVDVQPIGGWIRRRARLDQQSDHCSLHPPPRPVKWVNAKSLRLEIRGNRGLGERVTSPHGINTPGLT